MPQAFMLGSLVIKTELIMIIASFVIGCILFYFLSPFDKKQTRQLLDTASNILFTLIISLWIGKVLWNIDVFLSDPMAVLTYPSNTMALYLALILTIGYSWWKWIRTFRSYQGHLYVLITIFLLASFLHSFMEQIFFQTSWQYLVGLLILLSYLIACSGKKAPGVLANTMLIGWGLLQMIINAPVFQFAPSLIFYILIVVLGILQKYLHYSNGGRQF
ncbi:hypothetical protein [Gracilibacillus kekensis]|uniref:Uncharacterized protein n=1 Tax=Gracilibacillus kekensis TaxID=1027249 RepID=A0A1M7KKP3_9BACI|nr:hypothetical protein [Gracilibacillus kekensis]SHM65851.1 hypothetical protein SAMN05216179_0752 [Gracilibacillus kekensis]